MFEAITQGILVLDSTYLVANIIQGNQNNNKLPADTDFVIMTPLDTRMMGLNGANEYDSIQEKDYYVSLNSTYFQVDFYGVKSALLAKQMELYLTTHECAELFNAYKCQVYDIEEAKNLTDGFDRGKYAQRHVLRFRLFDNNNITINSKRLEIFAIDVKLAEAYDGN